MAHPSDDDSQAPLTVDQLIALRAATRTSGPEPVQREQLDLNLVLRVLLALAPLLGLSAAAMRELAPRVYARLHLGL